MPLLTPFSHRQGTHEEVGLGNCDNKIKMFYTIHMTSTFALVAFGFYMVSDWILRKRPTTDRAVSSATATTSYHLQTSRPVFNFAMADMLFSEGRLYFVKNLLLLIYVQ